MPTGHYRWQLVGSIATNSTRAQSKAYGTREHRHGSLVPVCGEWQRGYDPMTGTATAAQQQARLSQMRIMFLRMVVMTGLLYRHRIHKVFTDLYPTARSLKN